MMVIMIVLGIVPSLIIVKAIVHSYEKRAVSLRTSSVRNQCDILCNKLVEEIQSPGRSIPSWSFCQMFTMAGFC